MTHPDRIKAHYACAWRCDAALFDGESAVIPGGDGFEMICFGQGAFVHVRPELEEACRAWLKDTESKMLFDGEKLFELDTLLRGYGLKLRGHNVHYLPENIPEMPLTENCRWLERPALTGFHPGKAFRYAMNDDGSDVLALMAYQDGELAGLAAADDLWGDIWQIGIDVAPDNRGKGMASMLVSNLAREIIRRGKLPFYTTWTGNLASTRTALRCGFRPAWLSMKAIPL